MRQILGGPGSRVIRARSPNLALCSWPVTDLLCTLGRPGDLLGPWRGPSLPCWAEAKTEMGRNPQRWRLLSPRPRLLPGSGPKVPCAAPRGRSTSRAPRWQRWNVLTALGTGGWAGLGALRSRWPRLQAGPTSLLLSRPLWLTARHLQVTLPWGVRGPFQPLGGGGGEVVWGRAVCALRRDDSGLTQGDQRRWD